MKTKIVNAVRNFLGMPPLAPTLGLAEVAYEGTISHLSPVGIVHDGTTTMFELHDAVNGKVLVARKHRNNPNGADFNAVRVYLVTEDADLLEMIRLAHVDLALTAK